MPVRTIGETLSKTTSKNLRYCLSHRKDELAQYLERIEEAKNGITGIWVKDLGLFHIDEQVGQGLVLWKPNGAIIRQELEGFITEQLNKQGYSQVYTPHMGKLDLYRTSGHFPYYQDSQYPPIIHRECLEELAEEGMHLF